MPRVSRRDLELLTAALLAVALGVVLTWPVALHPGRWIVGHPGNDNWNHVWGYWWAGGSVLSGDWPDHTRLLAWPDGGTLYFIDTAQVLLALPFRDVLGPAVAYNLVMIGGFAFAAFAAWLLVDRLVGDAPSALVAMFIYGATPHLLGQAYNGISETICAGWVPLTFWCLLRVLDRPRLGRSLALGLVAGITVVTSWYYGLFAAMGSAVIVLWHGARQPYVAAWGRSLVAMAVALGVALLIVGPMLFTFASSLAASNALVSRDPDFVRASLLNHNITDLAAFFRPTKTPSPDLFALHGEELVIVIYLGWAGILLAGAALSATRRHRELAPWLWLGGIFFAFSLGPYLHAGGEYLEPGGKRVPLPFLAVFEALPIFDRISHPFRFVMGVALTLAVLAAHGLRHLLRRRPPGDRFGAALGVGIVLLVETAFASPATLPVPCSDGTIPSAYRAMATDPAPGAVLDLPLTVPNLERAVYVWYQAAHHRPVPWGLNDPMPRALYQNRLVATLVRMEAARARSLPPAVPALDLVVGARELARQGYRYVVLHERFYPDFKREMVEAVLRGVWGEPVRHPGDGLQVYVLAPVAGNR